MMNPTLSRRVGRLMMTDAVRQLDLDSHLAFVAEVSRARSFEALPDWVRDVVLGGEEHFAEVQAQRTSVIEPQPADDVEPRQQP